ncbi:major capsid protein [Treponema pedis]|uniref:major capsid protein n=1 Tax=Treponema pedis TaxID=409322 RepID=UPI003D25D56A
MPLNIDSTLSAYFTPRNIQDVLLKMPKPKSPIKDLLFSESNKKQKTSPFLSIAEVHNATGAIPVVKRGAASYPVGDSGKDVDIIQPEGFKPSSFISAKDLNDSIALGDVQSINAKLTDKVEELRDRIFKSTEILCAQSLSGTISYPAATAGGALDTYKVEIGKAQKMVDTDITGKKINVLQTNLESHFLEQMKTGASTDVRFLAGSDVYAEIVKIIAETENANIPVQWTDWGCVLFGKYKIMPISATYAVPGSTDLTNVIDTKTIKTIDLANPGTLFYLALDDFDAKLEALPFFTKQIKSDDPSGYKIIAMSKPFPALAVSKTVDRKYLA